MEVAPSSIWVWPRGGYKWGTWLHQQDLWPLLLCSSQVLESGVLDTLSVEERKRQEVRPLGVPRHGVGHTVHWELETQDTLSSPTLMATSWARYLGADDRAP